MTSPRILVLTGAGISAESGIATFRGPDGLWEGYRVEDVATPQAFRRDPVLVGRFYNDRRRGLLDPSIQPGAAHHALVALEDRIGDALLIVTQNIDDLHVRAGSRRVLAMHGELLKARCEFCDEVLPWREDIPVGRTHVEAECSGILRPHVVWFGEMPLGLDRIESAAASADVFIAIGTSGLVYPAAAIVASTPPSCHRIEINLEPTPVSAAFDESLRGPASVLVPQVVSRWLD